MQTERVPRLRQLARVLTPDMLQLSCLSMLLAGARLTPHASAVSPLRHTLWHPTIPAWCTRGQRACVFAVLAAQLRLVRQAEAAAPLPFYRTSCGC